MCVIVYWREKVLYFLENDILTFFGEKMMIFSLLFFFMVPQPEELRLNERARTRRKSLLHM